MTRTKVSVCRKRWSAPGQLPPWVRRMNRHNERRGVLMRRIAGRQTYAQASKATGGNDLQSPLQVYIWVRIGSALARQEFDHGVRVNRKADVAAGWFADNRSGQGIGIECYPFNAFAFDTHFTNRLVVLKDVCSGANGNHIARAKQERRTIDFGSVDAVACV